MVPDFVEVYDNALDASICRSLIDRFEASRQARRGEMGGGVDLLLKNSWDIPLHLHPGWSDSQQLLNDAVLIGFKRYVRSCANAALAPMRLQIKDERSGTLRTLDAEGIASLDEPTLNSIVLMLFRAGTINLQKYMADEGVPLLALRALPSARSRRDIAPCRSMDHLLERQLSRG